MNEPATKPRRRQRTNRKPPVAPPPVATLDNSSQETVTKAAPAAPAAAAPPPQPPILSTAPAGQMTQVEVDIAYQRAADERAKAIADNDDGSLDRTDHFYFDREIIPAGWDYQWKRKSVHGEEDPSYTVNLQLAGWTPVPARRHPEMMPTGYRGDTIERKGQILMEMPKSVVDRRRLMDKKQAMDQVRVKEQQLASTPPGTFERADPRGSMAKVGRSYAPLHVPGDVK